MRRKYIAIVTKNDVLIQAVAKDTVRNGFRLVEVAVLESGAEERRAAAHLPGPSVPSAMSKAGGRYRVSNGHRAEHRPTDGLRTDKHFAAGLFFHTAEIGRLLVSAFQLAAAGNHVIFSDEGGEIVHVQSGKGTALHQRWSIYLLRMWIPTNP